MNRKHCGKGETAHFELFHLFSQCFPRTFFFNVLKWVYIEQRVHFIPNDKILDWSKLKDFADDNSNFDDNGGKFSQQEMALDRSPKFFQRTTANIFLVSFREEFTRISLCLYSASSPIHQCYVYWQIKFSRTSFEKGHPRNISMKLFQNLTCGFREEDFLRISSWPYSTKIPNSPEPCLWTDKNFANNF